MYDDSESEVFFTLDAKQGAADCEVSAAADRKVFSESLHESEQECLYPIHLIYFLFLYNIAKNIITKPMNEMPGPTAVRIVLKMSG